MTARLIDLDRVCARDRRISVICPMYNEGAAIERNLRMLIAEMERFGRPWEIVVVNDGSTDDGLQKVLALAESHAGLTVVTYERNRGRGYALRKGLEHALGEIWVTTESDLSWGSGIVPRLVAELECSGADAVVASPLQEGGSFRGVPWKRLLISKAGNRLLWILMPIKLTFYTGMTRAYREGLFDPRELECDGKEIHLEILARLACQGARISEIPATLSWDSFEGKRKSSFKLRRHLIGHLLYGMGEAPFLVLGALSFLLLVLGTAFGLHLLLLSASGVPVGEVGRQGALKENPP